MATSHIELARSLGDRHQVKAAQAVDALNNARDLVNQANGLILGILNGGSNTDVETIFQLPAGTGGAFATAFANLASAVNAAGVTDPLHFMS